MRDHALALPHNPRIGEKSEKPLILMSFLASAVPPQQLSLGKDPFSNFNGIKKKRGLIFAIFGRSSGPDRTVSILLYLYDLWINTLNYSFTNNNGVSVCKSSVYKHTKEIAQKKEKKNLGKKTKAEAF